MLSAFHEKADEGFLGTGCARPDDSRGGYWVETLAKFIVLSVMSN